MSSGPQYNERSLFTEFFKSKRGGFVVEVGAANGVENSHTKFLIDEWEWSGILIEPHPDFFRNLSQVHAGKDRVRLVNKAICTEEGQHEFYLARAISRLFLDEKKKQDFLGGGWGKKVTGSVQVEAVRLDNLLDSMGGVPKEFDLLSIDAEGMDLNVVESMDWKRWRPRLVCIEHAYPKPELDAAFAAIGYQFWKKNTGNSFYRPTPEGFGFDG